MSQLELEGINETLENSVNKHRDVIDNLQRSPADMCLKKELIGLQKHIRMLSEKQKIIIQDQKDYLAESESRPDLYDDYIGNPATSSSISSSSSSSSDTNDGDNERDDDDDDEDDDDERLVSQRSPPTLLRRSFCSKPRRSMSSGFVVRERSARNRDNSTTSSSSGVDDDDDVEDPLPTSAYDIELQAEALRGYQRYRPERGYVAPVSASKSALTTSLSISELAKLSEKEEVDADINDTQLLIKTANEMAKGEEERKKLHFLACLNLNTPEVIAATILKRSRCDKRLLKFDDQTNREEEIDQIIPVPGPCYRRRGRPRKANRCDDDYDQLLPYKISSNLDFDFTRSAEHEDFCEVCVRSGDLLMCDTCTKVYHMACLEPPLETIPTKNWACNACMNKDTETRTRMKAAYDLVSTRLERENEIHKFQRLGMDLSIEKTSLEHKIKEASQSHEELERCVEEIQNECQINVEKTKRIKKFLLSGQNWLQN